MTANQHHTLLEWVVAWMTACYIVFALSPSPTNPLCYNSQSYRNTHEQECLINRVSPAGKPGTGGGGGDPGGLGGLLGGLLHLGGLL